MPANQKAWAPSAAPAPGKPLAVADNWFAIEWQPDGILRIWEPHVSRLLRANMFLIRGRDRDLVFDAGMGVASLRRFLEPWLDKPVSLFLSHTHVDHVGSAAEFSEDIMIHPSEAEWLSDPPDQRALSFNGYTEEKKAQLRAAGFDTDGLLIAAAPTPDYDPATWNIEKATPTRLVDEGDVVDLGDRSFTVLHTPGHTPGSICLFDEAAGILIGGDAIYDGLIIDTLPESDPEVYVTTMQRFRGLGARIIHGGHRESFGPRKLDEIIDGYLRDRD